MLRFDRLAGTKLVANEEAAYAYWIRSVRACAEAEQAHGAAVFCRVSYAELTGQPEKTMRTILDFLHEPFSGTCLEPLAKRINSSAVSRDDFAHDPATNPAIVREAGELWTELLETPVPPRPCPAAAEKSEQSFEERVEFISGLACAYEETQNVVASLQQEFAARTEWALAVDAQAAEKDSVIARLQKELQERTDWALALDAQSAEKDSVIARLQKEFQERTDWALSLVAESARKDSAILDLQAQLESLTGTGSARGDGTAQ